MLKLGVHKTFKGKRLYTEVWKDVVGFEGYYQVSNLGRVRGLDRIIEYEDGRIYYMKGGMMKTTINNKGYESLRLSKNHTRYNKTVHRLVIEAFIPNFDNKPCIDHINGIRTDNRIQNLRWVTYKENMNNEVIYYSQHYFILSVYTIVLSG